MMISAMAEAARVLRHGPYLESACRAADFLLNTLSRPDGGLYRTCRADKAHLNAYLEDYAYLTEALIDVYEVREAVRLGERLLSDFLDKNHGGFFTTANDHEALILRGREGPDGATPSGNAVAAMALARLSFHQDREDFRDAATQADSGVWTTNQSRAQGVCQDDHDGGLPVERPAWNWHSSDHQPTPDMTGYSMRLPVILFPIASLHTATPMPSNPDIRS